ncbi:MAG: hypothetical protein LC808_04805 [Actinobacteria bacterium]|nr:hypothetical protein [Actinomycetota bacterium]
MVDKLLVNIAGNRNLVQLPTLREKQQVAGRTASGNRNPDLLIMRGLRIDGSGRYQRRHSSGDKHESVAVPLVRHSW